MGPNDEHLKQVQRDAVNTTVRHFRDEVEDGTFSMDEDHLVQVRKDLIAAIDGTSDQPTDQPDASGKSAGGAAPEADTSTEDSSASTSASRADLNAQASSLGVESPEDLPNKQAVVDAIAEANSNKTTDSRA